MAIVIKETKKFIVEIESSKEWWIRLYSAGDTVPVSGIYRCKGCKREITSNKEDSFPPQNHHQHATSSGKIEWQLIVRTDTNGDNCGYSH